MRALLITVICVVSLMAAAAEEQLLDQLINPFPDAVRLDPDGLAVKFIAEVGVFRSDAVYGAWFVGEAAGLLQLVFAHGDEQSLLFAGENSSQYFVAVDRNTERQIVAVGYCEADTGNVTIIGWDKCSTGRPTGGGDYFLTPTGVFANTLSNFGYRAAGTKNEHGWRGLGKKDSRVWDFGWQSSSKSRSPKAEPIKIRLLMHATDPDGGEPKLGTPQSKGCVRISAKLNSFIDRYGIIDGVYLAQSNRADVRALLGSKRQPVSRPGCFLVVIDSTVRP